MNAYVRKYKCVHTWPQSKVQSIRVSKSRKATTQLRDEQYDAQIIERGQIMQNGAVWQYDSCSSFNISHRLPGKESLKTACGSVSAATKRAHSQVSEIVASLASGLY